MIFVLVIHTFGTAAARLVVESAAHQDGTGERLSQDMWEGDLEHTYTCYHACWDVLDVLIALKL